MVVLVLMVMTIILMDLMIRKVIVLVMVRMTPPSFTLGITPFFPSQLCLSLKVFWAQVAQRIVWQFPTSLNPLVVCKLGIHTFRPILDLSDDDSKGGPGPHILTRTPMVLMSSRDRTSPVFTSLFCK